MCPARPLRLLRSSRQPFLSEPPPLGSSFITLTWETQRDFFHPRALMFSLSQSLRCPFYTLFRRRHTSSSSSSMFLFSFFARPACSLFHAGDLAMFFQVFIRSSWSFYRVSFLRSLWSNIGRSSRVCVRT